MSFAGVSRIAPKPSQPQKSSATTATPTTTSIAQDLNALTLSDDVSRTLTAPDSPTSVVHSLLF